MTSVVWVNDGTSYLVSSINHLRCIAAVGSGFSASGSVPSYLSATYKQTVNIDCSAYAGSMIPIGNSTTAFTGNYDGQNYEIQNWQNNQSSTSAYQGIFGYIDNVNSIIKNISITGLTKVNTTGNYVGILCGGFKNGKISNIYMNLALNSYVGGSSSSSVVGGCIGIVVTGSSCIIERIRMKGYLTITASQVIGGVIGYIPFAGTTCKDIIISIIGNLTATHSSMGIVGGFCSEIDYTSTLTSIIIEIQGNITGANNSYTNAFCPLLGSSTVTNKTIRMIGNINGTASTNSTTSNWTYTYTDVSGTSQTIVYSDTGNMVYTAIVSKLYSFNFAFNETKTTYANIGIGTTSPVRTLDVAGDIRVSGSMYKNNLELGTWNKLNNYIYYTNGNVGINTIPTTNLDVNGTIRSITRLTTSDLRLKTNIQEDTLGLEFINNLKPKTFTYINNSNSQKIHGFIAQDIMALENNDIVETDTNGFYSIDIANLITPLINSIKELNSNYNSIEEEINKL